MKTIDELRPTEAEKKLEQEIARKIIGLIRQQGLDAMLVGSIAKGTALRGDKDLDIFMLFPKETKREELEKKGLAAGRAVCKKLGVKCEVAYAEHPYTRTRYRGLDVDIVPCYRMEKGDQIQSAVDRSPLHTRYVLDRLKNPDEVLLLKRFMKTVEVYGAEIETRGFSGYLCELLVLHYGNFERVLEEASKWKRGERIEIEARSPMEFSEPLIVIDPVDPRRNVAAAVSEEKLAQFITLAREFLRTKKLPAKAALLPERGKLFVVEWRIRPEVEEIIWSQLQRLENKLVKQLRDAEFDVIDSTSWTDAKKTAQILVELEVDELSRLTHWLGPSAYEREHARKFSEKYHRIRFQGDRLYSERYRTHTRAADFLKSVLKEVPSHLAKARPRIIAGAAARKTQAWKAYSKKFWQVG
jgi:tRNA nucleotidyltransferase (CCA-adding enzyme)